MQLFFCRLFITGLFFANSILLNSQVRDIIDKIPDNLQSISQSIKPIKAVLPCNFYDYSANSCFGISDPGVDSITAYKQAYLRALSMLALRNGLARGMSDFYNNANGSEISSNYEELSELKSNINLSVKSISIYKSIWLFSGELMLYINIDSSKVILQEQLNINSHITIYYKENEIDGSRKIINKISINNDFDDGNQCIHNERLTYITSNNRWLSNETFFDNVKIETDKYKIFYMLKNDCVSYTIENNEIGCSSVDGLWYALINNLFRQLSSQLKDNFKKVTKVGDKYGDKMISLNRESGFFPFKCEITDVKFADNKLLTRIKTNLQQEK